MTEAQFINQSFGVHGSIYTTDTTPVTAVTVCAIQALEDTVLDFTAQDWTGTTTSVPIPKGVTIFGRITAYTLASGKVIAYRRST